MAKSTGGYCSFCGRSGRDVRLLINGINGSICDECAQQAYEMVKEKFAESSSFTMSMSELPTPEDIKLFLDQYVIGQDAAKQYLAVSVYNHYKRLMQKVTADDVEIEKSNIILVGTTGTGKTLLARTIAKLLHVPFAIVDATRAMSQVLEETDVQIHGVLGIQFLLENKWCIDFEKRTVSCP